MRLAVVIPTTRGREAALDLVRRFLDRQTVEHERIIVQRSRPGKKIHAAMENVREGLIFAEKKDIDAVVVCEDDDWYGPKFLEKVSEHLSENDMASAHPCCFYNVRWPSYSKWNRNGNSVHEGLSKGLCGWGMHKAMIRGVTAALGEGHYPASIAKMLWVKSVKFNCLELVSLKGLVPNGITIQHRSPLEHRDKDGRLLMEWVGKEDAEMIFSLARSIK